MKQLLYFIGLFVLASSRYLQEFKIELNDEWQHYKSVYSKSYSDEGEEAQRRRIWEEKVESISRHNLRADLGLKPYRIGLNKYSDRTYPEFVWLLHGFRIETDPLILRNDTLYRPSADQIPDQVDWRNEGLVTPVKDQSEPCGACWAFSATGALEGQQKKKAGQLVSLSEQNLVDCCKRNKGCDGGDMDTAFECVKKMHGVDTEQSYPYKKKEGRCHFDSMSVGATCSGYVRIPSGNEDALKHAVASIGPISVGIDARQESFHGYKVGIYDEPDCKNTLTDLTHALLVIGYGTENGKDYWILKNSWGESFGIDGYIKMSRNKNNQCGIATIASYPIL